MRWLLAIGAAAALVGQIGRAQDERGGRDRAVVASPDGRVHINIWRGNDDRLRYSVTMDGRPVIEPSALGIIINGIELARGADKTSQSSASTNEEYAVRGVHTRARNHSNDAHIEFVHRETATPFTLDVRAFDDGVAFRYLVPGARSRTPDDGSEFRLPAGATVWYHDLQGHYEGMHARKDVADVRFGEWAAPPVTFKLPNAAGYGSITEGGLTGYSGMALEADGAGGFHARLAHDQRVAYPYALRYTAADQRRLSAAAAVTGPIVSPWRIVLATRNLNALVSSDIVRNVSAAPDRTAFPEGGSTAWIRPGRAVWRFLDGGDNTLEGLNGFTDLAARLGFEYHVVEGIWQRWTPDELKAFVDYAKARQVGVWLWKDSRAIRDRDTRLAFFTQCRDLGVVGVKIDFFDHEAKELIDLYEAMLRDAAAFHLMIDFHGANKPTGGDRTWPNELTREGVYGLEHRTTEAWAAHNTTLPFTRLLAGPADYTPVVFGERRRETSWAHQIATAAVFTSPLLVYGAHPQSLVDSPAVEIIKSIPAVWDETVVLPSSEIGELAAFARRTGDTWFVAVLNGPKARTVRVDLTFLPAGNYEGLVVRDTLDDPAALAIERMTTSKAGALEIDMRAGGGFVARLSRVQ